MIVERCWLCLEQPASATVELPDGRSYPVCDVCAGEQRLKAEEASDDATWATIIERLQ